MSEDADEWAGVRHDPGGGRGDPRGQVVIVVDDADRENEGDLIMAAEKATPEADRLHGHPRAACLRPDDGAASGRAADPADGRANTDHQRTAFTVSVDARKGVTTGISASDRATTIRAIVNDDGSGGSIRARPRLSAALPGGRGPEARRAHRGHRGPRSARGAVPRGGLVRDRQQDGTMARLPDLVAFAAEHGLKMISIADLIEYRRGA